MSHTQPTSLCAFCQQPCVPAKDWLNCESCDVAFIYTREGLCIQFSLTIGEWDYALNLYPDADKTVLVGFHKIYGITGSSPKSGVAFDRGNTWIELKHSMVGVTPQNVADKVKMMLVFQ